LDLTDAAEIIAVIRDIAFIVLLLVMLVMMVVVLVLVRKVSSVLNSAKRTAKGIEDMMSTVSGSVVKPAAAGSGVAFGAGKILAFILGLGRRKKKQGGSNG
jgi:hypothetical protein